jgi:hypothetical protein
MPKLIKHVRKDEQVVAKFATTVNNNRKVYHHNIFKGAKLANQFIAYICSRIIKTFYIMKEVNNDKRVLQVEIGNNVKKVDITGKDADDKVVMKQELSEDDLEQATGGYAGNTIKTIFGEQNDGHCFAYARL